jgi:phage major head subunit gpT-like protein
VVVEEQLTPIDLSTTVKMNEGNTSLSFASMSEDGEDRYDFTVSFSPFRIQQKVNGQVTAVINKKDTLMFENYEYFYRENPSQRIIDGRWQMTSNITEDDLLSDCFFPILERMSYSFLERHYGPNFMTGPQRPSWIPDFIRSVKSE